MGNRKPQGRNVPPRKPVPLADIFKPGVTIFETRHDSFCKVPRTQREEDCHPRCRPIIVPVRPFDEPQPEEGE